MELGFDVVELPPTDHVAEGETAPDFQRPLVNDGFWENRALSSLVADGPVLLLFHPMDGAFPATYLYNEIEDRGWTDDIRVVGLSISSPYEHNDLIADQGVDVALFSDPQNGVAESYGIAHDLDGMAGVSEPRPAVYLVGEGRTVEYAWVAGEWPAFPDYDAAETAIEAA